MAWNSVLQDDCFCYLIGSKMTFITIGIISLCLLEIGLVSSSKFEYPPAHRNESVVDTYQSRTGDVKIKDPYRWLECPVRSDTLEFVKTQNKLFQEFVDSNPERSRIKEKVTLMNRYPKWDFPRKIGDWYYFTANDGSQEQSIYYKSKTWHRDNPEVVFDPNKLSKGDDVITIGVNSYNKDASILAYVALRNGLDRSTVYFYDTTTGDHLEDKLEYVQFSALLWNKMEGVFYAIFPSLKRGSLEPLLNQIIMYHRLGTKQSEDILIAEFPEEPEARIGSPMSYLNEGKTLVVTKVGNGEAYAQNSLFTADIPSNITGKLKLEPFIPYMNAEFSIISVQNSSLLVKTDRNAPNWKLVRIYLDNPEESNWETVIEEDPKMVLTWVTISNKDKLIHAYLDDCLHWIRIRNLTDGEILVDRLPLERTNVNSFSSPEPDIFLFKVENATNPHTIYMLNFTKGLTNIELYSHFKLPNYEVDNTVWKEVFYPSYDGTKIHMFIVHKKNLKLDGSSFALVWGYGAFGTNIMPIYQPYRATLVENFNAIIALPNLRGGGEFGKKWNHLGQFANKQNSIDDFIAATEYLIKHGYTSSQKVWAEGRSAGGLLIGAIINQRPDLFAAVVPQVGVMDALRFHHFTMGYAWLKEFGNPEDPESFEYIKTYSPLHNIQMPANDSVQYPPVLVLAATHDDRVVQSHSLKYVAEMQHTIGGHERQSNPILMRVDQKTGHVPSKPLSLVIEEQTDILAFLGKTIGLKLAN